MHLHEMMMFLLQAAAPVKEAVVAHPSASSFGSQVGIAFFLSSGLEYLKDKSWAPFVKNNAATLNKISAAVVALISALGVTYVWDASARTFTVSGVPSLAAAITVLWTWGKQYAVQEMIYRKVIMKNP